MQDLTATAVQTELPPHFEIGLIDKLDAIRRCDDIEEMRAIACDLVRYNYGVRALILQMVKDQRLR